MSREKKPDKNRKGHGVPIDDPNHLEKAKQPKIKKDQFDNPLGAHQKPDAYPSSDWNPKFDQDKLTGSDHLKKP